MRIGVEGEDKDTHFRICQQSKHLMVATTYFMGTAICWCRVCEAEHHGQEYKRGSNVYRKIN
jgi:hypothetical protein